MICPSVVVPIPIVRWIGPRINDHFGHSFIPL